MLYGQAIVPLTVVSLESKARELRSRPLLPRTIKKLGGFQTRFSLYRTETRLCGSQKTKRRADSNTEKPTIKKEKVMKNQKFTSILLGLACSAVLSTALARPVPTPTPTPAGEDRGNSNSAAENVQALNLS